MAKDKDQFPMWGIPGYSSTVDFAGGKRPSEVCFFANGKTTWESLGDSWSLIDGEPRSRTTISGEGEEFCIMTTPPQIQLKYSRGFGNFCGLVIRGSDLVKMADDRGIDVGGDWDLLLELREAGIDDQLIALVVLEGMPYLYTANVDGGGGYELRSVNQRDFGASRYGSLPNIPDYSWSYSHKDMLGYIGLDIYPDRVELSYTTGECVRKGLIALPRMVDMIPKFDRLAGRKMPDETSLVELLDAVIIKIE